MKTADTRTDTRPDDTPATLGDLRKSHREIKLESYRDTTAIGRAVLQMHGRLEVTELKILALKTLLNDDPRFQGSNAAGAIDRLGETLEARFSELIATTYEAGQAAALATLRTKGPLPPILAESLAESVGLSRDEIL
jgi:hypothetical protein